MSSSQKHKCESCEDLKCKMWTAVAVTPHYNFVQMQTEIANSWVNRLQCNLISIYTFTAAHAVNKCYNYCLCTCYPMLLVDFIVKFENKPIRTYTVKWLYIGRTAHPLNLHLFFRTSEFRFVFLFSTNVICLLLFLLLIQFIIYICYLAR